MEECSQFPSMTILEHGESVHEWFMDLYNHLIHNCELQKCWRLPNWIYSPLIPKNLLPLNILQTYHTYHDIGKPYCRVVDEKGKQHFPKHEEISFRIWMDNFVWAEDIPCEEKSINKTIGHLILNDMKAHTIKGENIQEFFDENLNCAMSLILTALAEVHSNAAHLKQLDSTNFKIKIKQIDKLGKKFLRKDGNDND